MPSRSIASSGLPSGPRSRSQGRQRSDDYSQPSGPPRHVRGQRSMASMSSARSDGGNSRPPPMPDAGHRRYAPSDSGSSRTSDDSVFSSASSFLDRMRAGAGYSSSRTSLDDDDSYAPSKRQPPSSRGAPRRSQDDDFQDTEPATIFGYGMADGSAVWSSLSNAANNLTVNIGKSWATNIPVFAGEETPPGAESRLTRAMRAYHREKANTPADLPSWLFSESERRVREPQGSTPRQGRSARRTSEDWEEEYGAAPRAKGSRGLRDIYQQAAASTSPSPNERTPRRARAAEEAAPPSRATDRLKAMRDAKRSAFQSSPSSSSQDDFGRGDRYDNPRQEVPRASPRMGLPTGPGRVRRF